MQGQYVTQCMDCECPSLLDLSNFNMMGGKMHKKFTYKYFAVPSIWINGIYVCQFDRQLRACEHIPPTQKLNTPIIWC